MSHVAAPWSFGPLDTTVVVSRITQNVLEHHLQEIFEAYGPTNDILLVPSGSLEFHAGIAVIEYTAPDAATRAVYHMNGGAIDGQDVQVKAAEPEDRSAVQRIIKEAFLRHQIKSRRRDKRDKFRRGGPRRA